MKTASYLYKSDSGEEKCIFCGGDCSKKYEAINYIKNTFTNYNLLNNPEGKYCCEGCVDSMSTGTIFNLKMPDGEIKNKQSARTYSWILSIDFKQAYSKKHIKEIREKIFNPPEPPFSIIISDSGKKHLIFRAPIAYSKDKYPIQFEEEQCIIDTIILMDRILLCEKLIAFCGKKGILQYDYFHVAKYCLSSGLVDEQLIIDFFKVKDEIITEVAVFLSKNKEDCKNEYYADKKQERIKAEISWPI